MERLKEEEEEAKSKDPSKRFSVQKDPPVEVG